MSGSGPRQKPAGGAAADVAPPEPLKPRPGLFVLFAVLLALWVAFLLVLYFKTVYPTRHGPAATRPTTARSER